MYFKIIGSPGPLAPCSYAYVFSFASLYVTQGTISRFYDPGMLVLYFI